MTHVEQLHALIDRIADADARRDAALSDRAAAVDEIHQLLATEQPEQGKRPLSRDAAVGEHPAPVSPPEGGVPAVPPADSSQIFVDCPECGTAVKPQGLGSHQRKHKAGYTAPAAPTPAGTVANCPDCGHEVKAMGLGTHRRQKHGRGRATTLVKPPKNGHPSRAGAGREKFLCSRCPAQFPSREERDAHQAAHPEIPPAPVLRRAGEGTHAGFGE